jgi:hypothetical protein
MAMHGSSTAAEQIPERSRGVTHLICVGSRHGQPGLPKGNDEKRETVRVDLIRAVRVVEADTEAIVAATEALLTDDEVIVAVGCEAGP